MQLPDLKNKNRKELIILAGKILDNKCRGCEMIRQMKENNLDDDQRNRYCLRQCSIGLEIQKIGSHL